VPAFGPEGFDVRTGGFGHAQPVEGEQRDQRMLGRGAEPGGDEQGADFVAVPAKAAGSGVGEPPAPLERLRAL
jgi:hypothetical protein